MFLSIGLQQQNMNPSDAAQYEKLNNNIIIKMFIIWTIIVHMTNKHLSEHIPLLHASLLRWKIKIQHMTYDFSVQFITETISLEIITTYVCLFPENQVALNCLSSLFIFCVQIFSWPSLGGFSLCFEVSWSYIYWFLFRVLMDPSGQKLNSSHLKGWSCFQHWLLAGFTQNEPWIQFEEFMFNYFSFSPFSYFVDFCLFFTNHFSEVPWVIEKKKNVNFNSFHIDLMWKLMWTHEIKWTCWKLF